jgi:ribosomal protein L37AE/L43A
MGTDVSRTTAWLTLAVGADRQHGGNDGYDDSEVSYYSWDSTVPNHGRVSTGDIIVLWDKRTLLGASVIESITQGSETKSRYSCPHCGKASLKARKTKLPRWKCFKCGEVFDEPRVSRDLVRTYRSEHATMWVDLTDCLSGAELRVLCRDPKSQLSLRQLDWARFCRAVERGGKSEALQPLVDHYTQANSLSAVRL